jgi:hypothetical protein
MVQMFSGFWLAFTARSPDSIAAGLCLLRQFGFRTNGRPFYLRLWPTGLVKNRDQNPVLRADHSLSFMSEKTNTY